MRARSVGIATVALLAAGAAPAHAEELGIRTTPPLWPAYRAAVPDYTVRCQAGTPVTFEASIPPGQTVAVDGGPPAQDSLKQDVSVEPGQAFTFTVTNGDSSTTHDIRCFPADLPVWRVRRHGTPATQWIAFAPTQRE